MSFVCKIVFALIFIGAAYFYVKLTEDPPVQNIEEKWWGFGAPTKEDISIKPFKINMPDEIIEDLYRRLNNTLPFQPPLEGVQHHYGLNTNLLATIIDYWKTKYNWKKRQEFLNQFPQFQTRIQGLNIHFLHVKPKNVPPNVEVLPLLLLHGWPGSVREFYEILPILTTPQKEYNFVFEVIAPSLPGYGFSDGAAKQGLHTGVMAQILDKLMNRLKFKKYYLQGGDMGAIIANDLALLYPQRLFALHSNMCYSWRKVSHFKQALGAYLPFIFADELEAKKNYPSKRLNSLLLESGYFHIQATKPDTLGVALRDSPVGLAAYIFEKYILGTDLAGKNLDDGGLTNKFSYDTLLDNVMIYWIRRSMTTAIRAYVGLIERFSLEQNQIKVPAGCARFINEIVFTPKSILKDRYKELLHVSTFTDGGHFAALEVPNILANDVFLFVDIVRHSQKTQDK